MSTGRTLSGFAQPVVTVGATLDQASGAMVMVHGRGASPPDILLNVPSFNQPTFAYFAPAAPDNTWYPDRFLAPLEDNEPYLSNSLALLGEIVDYIIGQGMSSERIALFGFSQGACLTLEYVARNARRYGAVAGLSGGLIGPDELERQYEGALNRTPIFLGCSDVDFHVPKERVADSAEILENLGGDVTLRFYPNLDHTINDDELNFVRAMLAAMPST